MFAGGRGQKLQSHHCFTSMQLRIGYRDSCLRTVGGEYDECGGGDAVPDDEPLESRAAADQSDQRHVGAVVVRRRPVATRSQPGVTVVRQRPRELADDARHRRLRHRRPRSVVRHLPSTDHIPRPIRDRRQTARAGLRRCSRPRHAARLAALARSGNLLLLPSISRPTTRRMYVVSSIGATTAEKLHGNSLRVDTDSLHFSPPSPPSVSNYCFTHVTVTVRAAGGTEFLSPHPSHTQRKSCVHPHRILIATEPQNLNTHTRTLSFHYKRSILICCLSH